MGDGEVVHGRVYPRVGGGTIFRCRRYPRLVRSIPAWAGEPPVLAYRRLGAMVYPRVGGGTQRLTDKWLL